MRDKEILEIQGKLFQLVRKFPEDRINLEKFEIMLIQNSYYQFLVNVLPNLISVALGESINQITFPPLKITGCALSIEERNKKSKMNILRFKF